MSRELPRADDVITMLEAIREMTRERTQRGEMYMEAIYSALADIAEIHPDYARALWGELPE